MHILRYRCTDCVITSQSSKNKKVAHKTESSGSLKNNKIGIYLLNCYMPCTYISTKSGAVSAVHRNCKRKQKSMQIPSVSTFFRALSQLLGSVSTLLLFLEWTTNMYCVLASRFSTVTFVQVKLYFEGL